MAPSDRAQPAAVGSGPVPAVAPGEAPVPEEELVLVSALELVPGRGQGTGDSAHSAGAEACSAPA